MLLAISLMLGAGAPTILVFLKKIYITMVFNGICFVRRAFYQVGIGGIAVSGASLYLLGICQETALIGGVVGVYWMLGISDMNQTKHTILRNFPVLGRLRYIFEVLRPEIRQVCFAPQSSRCPPLSILGAASARWHGSSADALSPGINRQTPPLTRGAH